MRFLRHPLLPALLLFLLSFALFAPSIGYFLVNLDDPAFIAANPIVYNGFSWNSLVRAFTSLHGDRAMYSPLVWVSFLFDELFFRASVAHPWGFHFTNVLLHAANAILLFFILLSSVRRPWLAFFAAAFWALHPLRVESVAWVTERKDTLSTFFAFASILCYLKAFLPSGGREGHPPPSTRHSSLVTCHCRKGCLYLALATFVAGLLSKPMLVTLPFLFLLFDFWPLRRFSLRDAPRVLPRLALRKWPFFLPAILVAFLTRYLQDGAVTEAPLIPRLASLLPNYLFYFAKSFWPSKLMPLADGFPATSAVSWTGAALFLGLAVLAMIVFRRCPGFAVGLLAFAGLLFPVSGIVFIGSVPVADRYTYLPAIGLSLALLALLDRICPSRPSFPSGKRNRIPPCSVRLAPFAFLCGGFAAAVLALEAVVTIRILPAWENPDAFTDRIAAVSPDHYYVVAQRFKTAFGDNCNPREALVHAQSLFARRPSNPYAVNAMVLALSQLESSQTALDFFSAHPPSDYDPSSQDILSLSLVILFADVGDFGSALARLDAVLANGFRSRRNTELVLSVAWWISSMAGQSERALSFARQIPSFDSGDASAPANLLLPVATVWNLGLRIQALPHFLQLARNASSDPAILNNIAWILATSPNSPASPDDAVAIARQALALKPDNPVLRDTLAVSLAFAGRFEEAASLESEVAASLLAQPLPAAPSMLSKVQNRLALFQARQPFTENSSSILLYSR